MRDALLKLFISRAGMYHLDMSPMCAFQVMSALQLAARHPMLDEIARYNVTDTAAAIMEAIAPEEGPLRSLCLRGFDPSFDRPDDGL